MTYRNLNSLFRERMIELFNWNALVSYRVRCHNTFSLLKELRDVVDSWIKGYVQDFRTVGLCIEETINRVKNDNVVNFSFYEKRLFVQDLEDLQKTGEKDKDKCNRVLYLLDKCILSNKDMYLATLYSEIEKIIFRDEELPDDRFKSVADELNNLTEDLACELLNEGFSHRHLYNYSDKIELSNFEASYNSFKNTHCHNARTKKYSIIFRFNGKNYNKLCSLNQFVSKIPISVENTQGLSNSVQEFLAARGNWIYFSCNVEALDSISALEKAKEVVDGILDKNTLGISTLYKTFPQSALICFSDNVQTFYLVKPIRVLDVSYADDAAIAIDISQKIDDILKESDVSEDVKDRLRTAIRHLRFGNEETDPGQRLINYWIALEFIFSSPMAMQSTITRLEKNLINILTCGYSNILLLGLNEKLIKLESIKPDDYWWTKENDPLNTLINNQNYLLRYHLLCIKSHLLGHADKAQVFIKEYETHLKWHIYRIYRFRNRLVHEAAILPGLDNVSRDLRYYLVYVLNQIIGYFSNRNNNRANMNSFFFFFELKISLIHDTLKQSGLQSIDRINALLQPVIYKDLMRESE